MWKRFVCWLLWHVHIEYDENGQAIDETFSFHCKRCGEHTGEHYQ